MDEPTSRVMSGASDAKTTAYGQIINVVQFKVGAYDPMRIGW